MKIKKYMLICMALILVLGAFSGCGSSNTAQTPDPAATGNTVIMQDHTFTPAEITIKKGETVTWTNKDSAKHDVTSDTFKSDLLAQDQSFEQTFNDVGTFEYSCTPHPYMKGKIIVTE